MTIPKQPPALVLPAALLAAAAPALLAYHQPPSATTLNQCLAVALWGGLAAALAPATLPRSVWPLLAALAAVALGVWSSWITAWLPASLAVLALGLLAGAGLMVVAGADAARRPQATAVFTALAWGLLGAGVLSTGVAFVQVFAPGWADGTWIAASSLPGRAVGNLRQPNHLCSLLLWALVAAVALHELKRLPRAALWGLVPALVVAVELSASRTGAVGLGLLLLWGLLDRRLSPTARAVLVAAPLLYGLAFGAMAWWGEHTQQVLGAGARVAAAEGSAGFDSPNSRLNIWRNALALIAANPITGVGFGEFNFAWTLTAFPHRPTAFFDHTHNLPLQLAVELGLPLAGLVLLLLVLALWRAARGAWRAEGERGQAARAALVLVLMAGLHSLVEYPLWYAYFLMPAALAWGFALGCGQADGVADAGTGAAATAPPATGRPLLGLLLGVAMAAGGAFALWDYQRIVQIYAPPEGAGSLVERIQQGQRSPLFAHHADYAAATNKTTLGSRLLGLQRATHSLLDTRLVIAWSHHLAGHGQVDQARWLAQRLREFNNPDADEYFAACDGGATTAFQCQPPARAHDWREFLGPVPVLLPGRAASAQPAASAPATQ